MYFHQISFFPQLGFFLISFFAGVSDGLLCLFICPSFLKRVLKGLSDFVFCIISASVFVIINIAYQDASFRLYQLIAFLLGLVLVLIFIKPKTDKIFLLFYNKFIVKIINFLSFLFLKTKILLKRLYILMYNFIKRRFLKISEKVKINGKKNKEGNKGKNTGT